MRIGKFFVFVGFLLLLAYTPLWADGSEHLGPPSIAIAPGTGIAAAGTGMITQPGTISIEVPSGAVVNQVLLYWQGFMATNVIGDSTIQISNDDGTTFHGVTGKLIGGPTMFWSAAYASTFRADITSLGLIGAGTTVLKLQGLAFTYANNGAGILVIYDDGSSDAYIDLRDGSDLAYWNSPAPLDNTVDQTFTFPASNSPRTAFLSFFFASVAGSASGGTTRPSAIEITTAGGGSSNTQVLTNVLNSVDGDEWDTFTIAVNVPAKATSVTVQPFSRDDLETGDDPASFDWLAAAFALEPEVPSPTAGRMTGGGSVFRIDGARVTRGFEIHCDLREPNNIQVNWPGGKRFHLTKLTSAVCTDDPAIDQRPPAAPFDTFQGAGDGKYNGKPGARIEFVFVDAGEPGSHDTASIKIYDPKGNLVLDVPGDPNVPGYLDHGNIQAHKDAKATRKK